MKRLLYILWLSIAAACPSKPQALHCFYDISDTNRDHFKSKAELSKAIYSRLPWWKKTAFQIFGGIGRIMKDCDKNKDGYLTIDEAYAMPNTCMETCYKRQTTVDLFKCKL
jgi:hypothetical protein